MCEGDYMKNKDQDIKLSFDGIIELKTGMEPIEKIRRTGSDGKMKEWICVESDVFTSFCDEKQIVKINQQSSMPIMEFKKREKDNPVRAVIAKNLDEAISRRAEKGKKTEYLQKIAKDLEYGTIRALQNAKGSTTTPLHAEDILYFERELGIHRDEILGEIKYDPLNNLKGFRTLFNKMTDDSDLREPINDVLVAFNNALSGVGIWKSDKLCEQIKNYIESSHDEMETK